MSIIHPRRLARQIARAKLDAAGVTGYNQKPGHGLEGRALPSPFARNWKNIVSEAVKARKENKK